MDQYKKPGDQLSSQSIDPYQSTIPLPINYSSTNQLIDYILHLADNALVLGHRNSEWCGHAPVLEQDIAITNIALDLIGQARNFYQYAALQSHTTGVSEDTLAYFREAKDFKNCLLVEQPNGDWAVTILRQFFFSTYQYYLYQQLQSSSDLQIAAIAEKAFKEVTYHLRWSSEWVIRLGDGTGESHERMLHAINILSPFTSELFIPANYEKAAATEGFGTNILLLKPLWQQKVKEIFTEATLTNTFFFKEGNTKFSGKEGRHTKHLNAILKEMQILQRTFPGVEW